MGRKFLSKLTLVLLVTIIILFILGKSTNLLVGDFKPDVVAGMFSIIIGVFSFIQQKILSKKTKMMHFIFQLLTVLMGTVILIPKAYEYIKSQNTYTDGIVIGIYLLLLFSVAYATRNEHVEKSEISQAESLIGSGKKKKSKKSKKEDVDMDEIKKLMEKNK